MQKDFSESTLSGKHMIIDLKGVCNVKLMNDVKAIQELIEAICETYHYHILGKNCHCFVPVGITLVYMLSESHISLHTFPERNCIAIDIYTCKEMDSLREYEEIYDWLVTTFDALRERPLILDRRLS